MSCEHLMRRSKVRSFTRHADRSTNESMPLSRSTPLTMRHTANAATAAEERVRSCRALLRSRDDSALAGCTPGRRSKTRETRSCLCSGWPPEQENDVHAKPEHVSSNVTHLHEQRAEGENSGAGQSSRPRAARKSACAGRHGRTVPSQAVHGTP